MNNEFTDCPDLVKKFPKLLGETKNRYGLSLPVGWTFLLEGFLRALEAEIEKIPVDEQKNFQVDQVKQKLGRFCVYLSNYTPRLVELCASFENASQHICEVCGDTGKLVNLHMFLTVRCEKHSKRT